LCLYLFSPDPIGKVSKNVFRKSGRATFLQAPTEEEKTPKPHSRGYGAADPQSRTPNVALDSFIGRWTLDVEHWTFASCCEKGASAHSYLHLPIAV
jgi:hypothetical protein